LVGFSIAQKEIVNKGYTQVGNIIKYEGSTFGFIIKMEQIC